MARRKRSGALVGSAAQVKLGNRDATRRLLQRRQEWQTHAWDYFDAVGELKYGANYLANAVSRLRLFVGVRPTPDADPVPLDKLTGGVPPGGAEAVAALERLQSPFGGHAELLRTGTLNLTIAGEFLLIGRSQESEDPLPGGELDADDPVLSTIVETWEVRSIDEFEVLGDGRYRLKSDDDSGPGEIIDPTQSYVLRIWQSHPRWHAKPDSPTRGVLGSCEELLLLEKAARSLARSRPGSAGMLLVPDELNFGPADPTLSEGGDPNEDPLLRDLIASMITPIQDEDSAAAVVPMMVKGKAEHLKEFRHLPLERPFDEMIEKRTDRAIRRLAQGINLPTAVLLGMEDLNHWTAWLVDESTFKAHVEPAAQPIMEGLSVGYLHVVLKSLGIADYQRFVVWYDPSALVVRPDRTEDATTGVGLGAVSLAKWREVANFEESDAPTPEELEIVRAMRRSSSPSDPDREQRDPPAQTEARAITASGRKPLGDRLAAIDNSLRYRLYDVADVALHRSLERAGNVLASRANRVASTRPLVAAVKDKSQIGVSLGPALVADIGGGDIDAMLESPLQALAPKFDAWSANAASQTLALLPGLTESQREMYELEFERHRADAWALMMFSLLSLARGRLFDPNPAPPDVGEVASATSLPFGLVRETVARAGGAAGLEKVGAAVMVAGEPAGGIATGSVARSALATAGHEIEGWRWDYGEFPRERPFEPHQRLDGLEFTTWTDDRLHNSSGWPHVEWFVPGDHENCCCNFSPIVIERR